MEKASKNIDSSLSLDVTTTYQSGVAQASAFRVVKHHTAHYLQDYNLTCMQWFTIGTVLDAGPKGIRLSDLAHKLDTTIAYMTNTVNLLESLDIFTKKTHKYDARTKLVAVKPHYKKTCATIEKGLRLRLGLVLYQNLSYDELATYVKVLYKISKLR
ncbi:MAG: hypothetical protein M3Q14_00615 [bacterium]|nr:hypothetical protein [bacterium]